MDERRGELGLTWDQVAEIADVSSETLRRTAATDGSTMRTTTKKGVERALRWGPDYARRISNGHPPIKVDAPAPQPPRDEYDEMSDQLTDVVARLKDMQRQVDAMRDGKRKGA